MSSRAAQRTINELESRILGTGYFIQEIASLLDGYDYRRHHDTELTTGLDPVAFRHAIDEATSLAKLAIQRATIRQQELEFDRCRLEELLDREAELTPTGDG